MPSSYWNILGRLRDTVQVGECQGLDTGPWGQNSHFYSVGPKKMWPRNCLKLHPVAVFLFLLDSESFDQPSGNSEASRHSQQLFTMLAHFPD